MRPLLLTALLTGLLPAVAGADASPARTTFEGAVRAALGERPMVVAATAEATASAAAHRAMASRYLPRLSLAEQFNATNEPGGSLFIDLNQESLELSPTADAYNAPPSRHDFATRLTLSQPLFDPKISYGTRRAAVQVEAATALLDRQREEAAFAVLDAYLAVQQQQARQSWAEQALAEAEEIQALATERETAGTGLHADTLRSVVLLNEARRTLLAAGNDLITARRRLAMTMGRPDGEVEIAVPLSPERFTAPETPDQLRRTDLDALARRVEDARLAVAQQTAAYLPTASMQASYILHDKDLPFGNDAVAWSVGAGLEWTLFDFGERSHRIDQARARRLALEQRHLERVRLTRLAVREAVLRADEAETTLALAESALQAAQEARDVTAQRYEAGLATMADLLTVQAELARTRSDLVAARVGLVRSRAAIHYQRGSLLSTLGMESEEPR